MVRIFTDTSSLFTPAQGREMGFDVAPLTVTIAEKTYREREEIETSEFIDIINQGYLPTSSQPSPADLMAVYEKATAEEPVLHITITDGLSGAYQSACGVREMMDNKEKIHVFNSITLCGPHRYMVEKAQKMKEAGHTAGEILDWLNYAATTHESFLIPQDFAFLRRGGRLTPMAATIGSVLKIKPVMTQTPDGKKLDKFTIKRTMKAAVQAVMKKVWTNDTSSMFLMRMSFPMPPK